MMVPFTLGVVPWKEEGVLRVTVIVKATFSAATSPMTPGAAPEPYRVADAHHRNQPMAHVVAAADRAPYKPRVDVTVLGHAQPAGGKPAHEARARIMLLQGGVARIDKSVRVIGARRSAGAEPLPFVRMPLVYERAFGGLGTPENPIGCGEDEEEDDDLPNILDPEGAMRPIGFGPLSAAWPIRKRKLGATPARDVESPLMTLPSGFDASYFQSAPVDQQLDELAPDATLVLEGFDPARPRVEIMLPGARALGAVYGLDADKPDAPTPIELRADTLHLDADRWIATISFRGSVEIRDESRLEELVIATGIGLGGQDPVIPAARPGPDRIRAASELVTQEADEAPVGGTLVLGEGEELPRAALPFSTKANAASPARGRSSDTLVLPLSCWSKGPTRSLSAATLPIPPSLAAPLPPPAPLISPPPLMPPPPPPEEPAAPAAPLAPPARLDGVVIGFQDAPRAPHEIVDLEEYGRISAAISEQKAKPIEVLRARSVDPEVYRKAAGHWRRVLDEEAKQGGRDALARFDEGFVQGFEEANPGRFGIEHYARLVQAERSARLANELRAQGLEVSLGMRLRRVYRRRVAADPALRASLDAISKGPGRATG